MAPKQDIIGIVKELQERLAFHESNGYSTASEISYMREDVQRAFPSIASALLIAVEALENANEELPCDCSDPETDLKSFPSYAHTPYCQALSSISSLPLP